VCGCVVCGVGVCGVGVWCEYVVWGVGVFVGVQVWCEGDDMAD